VAPAEPRKPPAKPSAERELADAHQHEAQLERSLRLERKVLVQAMEMIAAALRYVDNVLKRED
jgi:hypothetical protein